MTLWKNTHVMVKALLILSIIGGCLLAYKLLYMYQQRTAHIIEFWTASNEQNTSQVDHSKWQIILNFYLLKAAGTDINLFDYDAMSKEHKHLLEDYLIFLQAIDPRQLTRDQQLAYWINLYNAVTVNLIVDSYPTDSIRNIGQDIPGFGPWDDKVVEIVTQTLTLNQIEHGILRSNWQDNRIHYAINCASVGCPSLSLNVYKAKTLEAQLNDAAKGFIKHSRAVQWVSGELQLSSIYDWFIDDFGGDERGVISHIQQYSTPEQAGKLAVYKGDIHYDYDWRLNDVSVRLLEN